jgi:hypothetical protein
MWQLVLTHDTTVNLLVGQTQVYLPGAKAGQQVAYGQLELVRRIQQHYLHNGYGTTVRGPLDVQ